MRRVGFYFVQHLIGRKRNPDFTFSAREWVPAYWDGKQWWMIGESSPASRGEGQAIFKVGRRIYRPRKG